MTYSAVHDARLSITSRTDRGGYVIAALRGELGSAITGRPGQPGAIFPPAAIPARGHRIDGAIAGVAAQPARPAIDLAAARAGQGRIS